jgi:hypothetical protein
MGVGGPFKRRGIRSKLRHCYLCDTGKGLLGNCLVNNQGIIQIK